MALVINKGASSSSFIHQLEKFDVFLSFRGEDTRYSFISHLYVALHKRGIHTFIDDKLPRGAKISAQLFKTIEKSTMSIIVFSENYASSTWCLDELAKIVECKKNGQLMIPVFYKVNPSEIRKQNGKFGDALAEHEKNMDSKKVQRWRNALQEAANISGWHYNNRLSMHNLLQQMGKDIVQQESPQLGERSRLWCYEDVLDVLTKNMGSEKARGIMICAPEPSKIQLESKCLEKMENLKFLMARNVDTCGDLKYLPNGLRVLDWPGFPSSSLPSNFRPPKLVVLNVPKSQLILPKHLERIQCKSLTYMNLESCQYVRKLPDLLITTPNIKQLNLCQCINLVKVRDSVGCLEKLESLDLTGCIGLKILPSYITMKSLKILILHKCKRVKRFPDISQEMENLKFLSLACTAIRELPSSFRNLYGLERLDIGSYSCTCHLPSSIYELPHLQKLFIYGSVQFPEDVQIGIQALRNSCGGFSKYGFLKLNFLKKLTSCFHLSKKWLLSRGKTSNLKDNIMRFNGLRYLLIEDSKFLKEIPELPESIKSVCASNCISLNSQSIRNLFDQFGRILDFPPNMICSREKGNVLADSHSHRIDYSSRHSFSKFFLIVKELRPTSDINLFDFAERYSIIVPERNIPEWFNHQSIESSILFWIGPKFSTFAFCIAFHLVPLKDNYAKKYGSLRDDRISWCCAVDISINGQAQSFMQQPIFQYLKCDHLWFYAVPHSQLQQKFGDLLQGDQNCVEISCKISHWTSEFGKFAPVIAGMGVHVKCICPSQNSIIIDNYSQNVDDNSDNTEFAPLLLPATTSDGSHMNHVSLNGRRHRRTSTSSNR